MNKFSDSRLLQLATWLDQPRQRAISLFVITLLASLLNLVTGSETLFAIIAILTAVYAGFSEWLILYGKQKRYKYAIHFHVEQIQGILEFEMQILHSMLKKTSQESLEIVLMLSNEHQLWQPIVRFNLNGDNPRYWATLRPDNPWMNLTRLSFPKTSTLPLTDKNRQSLSQDEAKAFAEVQHVLIAPIHQPNTLKTSNDVIAALVVYSSRKQSILDSDERRNTASIFCEQIARLLSSDYLRAEL